MRSKLHKFIFIALLTVCFSRLEAAADTIPVFVSIVPQKYFVQQIGKGRVAVHVMVQPGASPATYEPKPRQMAALTGARLYFAIGVPFENTWLKKIAAANPRMTVVRTDKGIAKIPMAAHDHHEDDDHHKDDDHDQHADHHADGIPDPHIWLAPPLVKQQARTILTALQAIDPGHSDEYAANFREFVAVIDTLDTELRALFKDRQGRRFMVFHPSWGYFAQTYGLEQVAIEIEGKNPKPAQLQELIEHAREQGIKLIFAQPQFSTKSAALVAREINGQVIFADPLAADWPANLREVARKIETAAK